ncbi:MAG: hypothetical protein E7573_10335 [Ruminococcaceae bacterium]|nr:hypothetical protein [Oscillospiraceae bacterium]MBR3597985.1 hypothetical protein [Clostridia bacterium]
MSKLKAEKNYIDSVHLMGRLWSIGALIVLFMVPVAISVYYNAWPPVNDVFNALLSVAPLFWISSVVEVIAFTPMLGAGGAYLSFVTGNISNLKLPCAMSILQKEKVSATSEEGEILSTISVAASAITTTVIIAVGIFILNPVFSEIKDTPIVKQVLPYVTAALFGALAASYLRKYWKIAIAPILAGVIVLVFSPLFGVGTLVFVTIVVSVAGALLLSKFKLVK